MKKVFESSQSFYSFLLAITIVSYLVQKVFTGNISDSLLAVYNLAAFVMIVWFSEQIISDLYKHSLHEIRIILFLLLFFSPFIHYYLFISEYEYLALLFMLFSFFNIHLYIKFEQQINLLFITAGALFSIYFFPYVFFALIVPLIYTYIKAGIKMFFYPLTFILFLYFMYNFGFIDPGMITTWSLNNYLSTGNSVVNYNTINLLFSLFPLFHPLFFSPGIIVLPFIRPVDFDDVRTTLLLTSLIIYTLFIAGLPFQPVNMLILSFPLCILILFPAIVRVVNLTEYFRPVLLKALPYIIVVVQLSVMVLIIFGYLPKLFNS